MMGVQLANVALIRWAPHISGRAFRVLMRMSLTALDTPSGPTPAATYFGGMEPLTMTLRTDGTSAERTAYRALQELVNVGAIENTQRGQKGRRAVYRLTLDGDPKVAQPVTNDTQTGKQPVNPDTQNGLDCQAETAQPVNSDTSACPPVSPLGTMRINTRHERLDDEVVASPAVVQTAREDEPTNDLPSLCPRCKDELQPDGYCFGCKRVQLRSVS
jgi:hypothetical protein